jgi:hypothetical protein
VVKNKELDWVKIPKKHTSYTYLDFDEYVDTTERFCKQVWNDGYEEIFELSGRKL